MSAAKLIPEGLKMMECEQGVRGKNSLIFYILEQDPIQDALEKSKQTTYFKLTLQNMENKLKVAMWASGTPKQFLLHERTATHACKQIGLDIEAKMMLESAHCELDATKTEYAQLAKAT